MIYYFLEANQGVNRLLTNYKESIATIYSAFLLANITTEQPRRLTAMAYLITAFMDFKENKDKPSLEPNNGSLSI